jgi:putative ABC transport system permease protein
VTLIPLDIRDAFRALRRDRLYAATVVVTLGLTIGATTAVFSIVNGVLLEPLAYREAHRLVSLREAFKQFSNAPPGIEVNEQHFEYWRQHAQSFESMAQFITRPANLTGVGDAAQIAVTHASGSLFDVLQVPALVGRPLSPRDELAESPYVAVLTESCWRERFAGDPSIVGRSMVLDGRPYSVVGVMPASARLPEAVASKVDAFVAIRLADDRVGWVGDHNNAAVGRLKAGVSPEAAQSELNVLQAHVSELATNEAHEPVTLASFVAPLTETIVGRARRGLLLLLGAIGAVLLIACSNLANLSLTRTIGRLRDAAIRSALGASRRRLVGRAFIEQAMLSAAGGALGVWVASIALSIFVRTAPVDLPRVNDVRLDSTVLLFAASISMLTAVLVALLPAWRIGGRQVQGSLRAGGLGSTTDRGGMRTRASLLSLQVALSVTLLVVTALLTVSFIRLANLDPGFTAERALAVDISMPASRYTAERVRQAAYDRLLAAIQALPGVESASTTSMLPLRGSGQVNSTVPEGSTGPRAEQPNANYRFVGPQYFRTMGIPIARGRAFTDAERSTDRDLPSVISESTAARLWPGQDPLGKHFSRGLGGEQGFEVVGIVGDARTTTLERRPPLMVYVPYWWRTRPSLSVLIRTTTDAASLMPAVRRIVREIDPDIAIGQSRPLDRLVDAALAGRRYQMQLFVAFGVVALVIAVVGVYSVTAFGVSRRRREMNIRVALGAEPAQVIAMVVRQGTTPVAAGAVAGAGGALAIGGLVASLLFDVGGRDPIVIAGVAGAVGLVGFLSCVTAARRAIGINPAAVLRDE